MQVAELFVRRLEDEGVRYVFGVPGEETEDLLFASEGSRIEFVPTGDEQGTAFMASSWGRLTGHGDLSRLHDQSHQNLETVSMSPSMTKRNSAVAATTREKLEPLKRLTVRRPGIPVDPSVNFDPLDSLEAHWTGESSGAKNEEAGE